MVHRTSEHDDGLVRIALSGRFNNALEKTYVEHGYPTPYKYSYQTDLIRQGLPDQADLATGLPGRCIGHVTARPGQLRSNQRIQEGSWPT